MTSSRDLRDQATRTLYAGVGAADRAVAAVRTAAADLSTRAGEAGHRVQQTVTEADYHPGALRDQAVTLVSAGVETLARDAQAVRRLVETRVGELQGQAAQQAQHAYAGLARRGESLVDRIRGQESTRSAAAHARTTVQKARTTRTQATGAAQAAATAGSVRSTTDAQAATRPTTGERASTASSARSASGEPAAKRPTRATTAGTKASGTKASGTKASGTKASGTKASGTKASGRRSSGAGPTSRRRAGTAASSAKATTTAARNTASDVVQAAGEAARKVGD